MAEPIIELKNIIVNFGSDQNAVDNVNLSVKKGSIHGIIGFSGAGKSTLVRTINLLQVPISGDVLVNNREFLKLSNKELNEARKKIGMIFQHFNLLNTLTVKQNVAFPLKDGSLSNSEIEEKVDSLLELVGLSDKKDSYPRELSGGQKQRVAIARSLANDPDILISDEGTSALDPKTTEQILNLLKNLNKKLGITIVLITHQMEAIKQICDTVDVMDEGRIIEEGSIVEIFSNPQKALTQSFVNSDLKLTDTFHKVLDKVNKDVKPGEINKLFKLSYKGHNTDLPITSGLYKEFGVKVNILYGDIDILQDTPIGNLIVIISGKSEQLENAINYLIEEKVRITEV